MRWLSEINATTVSLEQWRADRNLRWASAAACDRFKADRQYKPLAECVSRFLETPILSPLSRSVLYAECERALTQRDVYLRPLHYLAWSAGVILNGERCAINGCVLPPTCLDHDHIDADGTGNVRGLLCSVHNHRYLAPSGPRASLRTFSPEMTRYLDHPPLAHLDLTYVNSSGYPDGWTPPVASDGTILRPGCA
jgi:hypothetical protein